MTSSSSSFLLLSVTRFGKISPLWHKLTFLWQCSEGLFSTWQKLVLTSVNFVYNWAISNGSKWTNNKTLKASGHTAATAVNDVKAVIKGWLEFGESFYQIYWIECI